MFMCLVHHAVAKYRVSTNSNNISNKETQDKTRETAKETITVSKMDLLRLFALRHVLVSTPVHLRIVFAAETHLGEGQWLYEQLNTVKSRSCRVGTQLLTA
jgi:hypothetical protein